MLRVLFTGPLCLQKDPGEPHKGAFERGDGLTMEENDLYSSWKPGNGRRQLISQQAVKQNVVINNSYNHKYRVQYNYTIHYLLLDSGVSCLLTLQHGDASALPYGQLGN